jgi:glyoxalase family protein
VLTDTPGLPHVTGIVCDAQQAVGFYDGTLGLRLLQQTVNCEYLLQHHLYFGDARETPGSVLTVFPDPYADDGRVGRPQPETTGLAVPERSLADWRERLAARGVDVTPVERFDGESGGAERARVHRPVGTRLELVASDTADAGFEPHNARVDGSMAVRGLHGVTLRSGNPYATASTLETLGYEYERETPERVRYRAAATARPSWTSSSTPGRPGARGRALTTTSRSECPTRSRCTSGANCSPSRSTTSLA